MPATDSSATQPSALRVDRLVSLRVVRPFRRISASPAALRIPILMYHSIAEPAADSRHPYFGTVTSPAVFEQQMRYLHDNGFQTLSPADVFANGETSIRLVRKPVIITFDDGFRDFYTHAQPILAKFGFTGIVYLPTAYIQKATATFKGIDCLTWNEVRELSRAGVLFGSHTVTHPILKEVAHDQLEAELRDSKATIENELGFAIDSFAYPYAFPQHDREFVQRLRGVLIEAGYQNGVSTVIGSTHGIEERFSLKRLPANSWDDPSLFAAKLNGDYDWLGNVQSLSKSLKAKFS
ncbi:MAG TPA: polysaccharide deacetylase family protein [Candidatus Acidoferrum sp.]|nr:polysaccharide deacetylase family protein [Candidatus Acidoferrum sp.]